MNVYTYTYTCNISEEGKGSTAAKEIIFFQRERKKTFISLFFLSIPLSSGKSEERKRGQKEKEN